MTELDADIICVTETHFGEEYDDAELSIPNYNLFRVDRNVNGGGQLSMRIFGYQWFAWSDLL